MAWSQYSSLFVTSRGRSKTTVPRSCIESAEYIMQCIDQNKILEWKPGKTRDPHVLAHFKGEKIDITETPDFHLKLKNPEDYPFTDLPDVGEGLVCVNKTNKDLSYNMHFGAVVARDPKKALISNMMEEVGISVKLTILQTIEIGAVHDFRSLNFSGLDKSYALGLLTVA